jgi:small conductance mechanosensitive channel
MFRTTYPSLIPSQENFDSSIRRSAWYLRQFLATKVQEPSIKGGTNMSPIAWESFITRIMAVGVNALQGIIRIAVIVAIAYVVVTLLRAALSRLEALLIRSTGHGKSDPGAAAKRIKTLSGVIWAIGSGLLWFIVILIALSQIGVNIGPILAGAGVVGLAVGFGAQHLVRDLVSGFFLLLENQIRVGDMAFINGTGGMIEAVTFRTVILRDQAGVVHVFPNGTINTLANATMDWSAYVIDVSVSDNEDTDRVVDIMRRVADDMRNESAYTRAMIEPIEIFGVDNSTEVAVTIKARFKTQPAQQYTIGREYRRRLKKAFDSEGVELANAPRRAATRSAAPVAPA